MGWCTPLASQQIHQSDFWSKQVAVVVKNLMAIPIPIIMGIMVTQVGVANVVTPVEIAPRTQEKLDEIQDIQQQTRMMVEEKKELLFQQLDLSGLDKWSDRNQAAA